MNNRASVRYARTMTTGAENAGRNDSYERARKGGIDVRPQWMATLDGRTRDSYRALDGEVQGDDGKFSNGCRFPGDPEGRPEEVYNCRCTEVAHIAGLDKDFSDTSWRPSQLLQNMSYDEWKAGHKNDYNNQIPDEGIVQKIVKYPKLVKKSNEYELLTKMSADMSKYHTIHTMHSFLDDVHDASPNYRASKIADDSLYTKNCQRCVIAFEARERGYDVIAKSRGEQNVDPIPMMLDKAGWPAIFKNGRESLLDVSAKTNNEVESTVQNNMESYGNGSRAIIRVKWTDRSYSHVFIAYNDDGKIRYFDPQSGKIDVKKYFKASNPRYTYMLRIDDKEFTELISECVEDIGK